MKIYRLPKPLSLKKRNILKQKLASKHIVNIAVWTMVYIVITAINFSVTEIDTALLQSLLFTGAYFAIYKLQEKLLFPYFQKTRKTTQYIVSLAFLLALFSSTLIPLDRKLFRKPNERLPHLKERIENSHSNRPMRKRDRSEFWHLYLFINILKVSAIPITLIISISKSFTEESNKARLREQAIIAEKLKSEMNLLKSQINPHFLFNALNNIYSLSYRGSEQASEAILKLSGILRYVIYDCNATTVSIEKEVSYLEDLIELQQLKTPYQQNIRLTYKNMDNTGEIAPMLLIPFVENSFKHSKIESDKEAYITINLVHQTNQFLFTIENSIPKTPHQKDNCSGIGHENVRKRLNHAYPNRHELKISRSKTAFKVELILEK